MTAFFFTYSGEHNDERGKSLLRFYTIVEAPTEGDARAQVSAVRGSKWLACYASEKDAGVAERRLKAVPLQRHGDVVLYDPKEIDPDDPGDNWYTGKSLKPKKNVELAMRLLDLLERRAGKPLCTDAIEHELGIPHTDRNRVIRAAFEILSLAGHRVVGQAAVGYWIARSPREMELYANYLTFTSVVPTVRRIAVINRVARKWRKDLERRGKTGDGPEADGPDEDFFGTQGDLFGDGFIEDPEEPEEPEEDA